VGGGGRIDWIDLGQGRDRWRALVSTVMNVGFRKNAGNFLSSLGRLSFSRRTLLHGVSLVHGKMRLPMRELGVAGECCGSPV
jgi:hypothetical protein